MADAFEAAAARLDMGLQDGVDAFAQSAVGMADDAGAEPAERPVALSRTTPGFADGPQFRRPLGAVFLAALDEYRGQHIVAGPDVGGEVFQQIPALLRAPQMVVRIDYRLGRVDAYFDDNFASQSGRTRG